MNYRDVIVFLAFVAAFPLAAGEREGVAPHAETVGAFIGASSFLQHYNYDGSAVSTSRIHPADDASALTVAAATQLVAQRLRLEWRQELMVDDEKPNKKPRPVIVRAAPADQVSASVNARVYEQIRDGLHRNIGKQMSLLRNEPSKHDVLPMLKVRWELRTLWLAYALTDQAILDPGLIEHDFEKGRSPEPNRVVMERMGDLLLSFPMPVPSDEDRKQEGSVHQSARIRENDLEQLGIIEYGGAELYINDHFNEPETKKHKSLAMIRKAIRRAINRTSPVMVDVFVSDPTAVGRLGLFPFYSIQLHRLDPPQPERSIMGESFHPDFFEPDRITVAKTYPQPIPMPDPPIVMRTPIKLLNPGDAAPGRHMYNIQEVPWGTYRVEVYRNEGEFPVTSMIRVEAGCVHIIHVDLARIPARRDGGLANAKVRIDAERADHPVLDMRDFAPLAPDEFVLISVRKAADAKDSAMIAAEHPFIWSRGTRDLRVEVKELLQEIPEDVRPIQGYICLMVERWTTTQRPEHTSRRRIMGQGGDLHAVVVAVPASVKELP